MSLIRMNVEQAVTYLLDKWIDNYTLAKEFGKPYTKKEIDTETDRIYDLANNFDSLKNELKESSKGAIVLKGSRGATNISFAPSDVQTTYKELESKMGELENFVGKNGDTYTMGVYCKKVVKKEVEGKKEVEKK